jgi:hypothetical protein
MDIFPMEIADDLTTARARVAEIKARIKETDDEETREYLRLCVVQWDRYIARLEAKANATVRHLQGIHLAQS